MAAACGNIHQQKGGRILKRCPNQCAEGSMFCLECKADKLERVRAMNTRVPAGLRWPVKGRA